MDFFQAQEFFKTVYPDVLVTFEFDEACIRKIECMYTDNQLHVMNHVEYDKVKVTPLGGKSVYSPISPHREIVTSAKIKSKIPLDDIYIHPDQKEQLTNPIAIQNFSELSGLSVEKLNQKLSKNNV